MKRKLELQAPVSAPMPALFDTRRGAVRKWVQSLPTANVAELGRRVHEAVRQVNGQRPSVARLLHFLEAVGPSCGLVLADLQRHYAHHPLPLSQAGARGVHLAVELLTELLRGYYMVLRTILPEKEEASRWRTLWYRRELVTTLHRFIRYGDNLLEIYRVLHMDPPEGAWRRLHRCYRLAEAHGLIRVRVPLFGEKRRSSLEQEYKRLLLSALLPAGALSKSQQKEIHATLDRWVDLLELRPASGKAVGASHLVRLARDLGPLSADNASAEVLNSANTRLLDNAALCASLARARDGKGAWWRREVQMTAPTLALLYDHWCSTRHRSEPREAVDEAVEVVIGLAGLFHLAGGVEKPKRSGIVLEPLVDTAGSWVGKHRQEEVDVWQSIYPEAAKARPAPVTPEAPAIKEADYSAVAGRLMDRSEHGLAVALSRKDVQQIAIGALVAVRVPDGSWIVSSAVRLKDSGEMVELGLKILMHGAIPVRVHTRDGARVSPRFEVVVGHGLDGQLAIAVPTITALRRGGFMLDTGDKEFSMRRGATLAHSRFFEAFSIELPDPPAQEAIEEAAKGAATRAGGNAPHALAMPLSPTAHEQRIAEVIARTGLSREDAEFIIEAEREAGCG